MFNCPLSTCLFSSHKPVKYNIIIFVKTRDVSSRRVNNVSFPSCFRIIVLEKIRVHALANFNIQSSCSTSIRRNILPAGVSRCELAHSLPHFLTKLNRKIACWNLSTCTWECLRAAAFEKNQKMNRLVKVIIVVHYALREYTRFEFNLCCARACNRNRVND